MSGHSIARLVCWQLDGDGLVVLDIVEFNPRQFPVRRAKKWVSGHGADFVEVYRGQQAIKEGRCKVARTSPRAAEALALRRADPRVLR